MILNVYSIFDVKSDSFNTPFFAPTNGIAIRQFSDLANDPQSTLFRHSSDFKLVRIGTFDPVRGHISACDPESLGFASDYTKPLAPSELRQLRPVKE